MKTFNNSIKKIAALAGIILFGTSTSFAQKSGVFKSYADFQEGKMEYGINCATEKHKIKLNDFLGKDYITVVHDGKPYNLKKAETWGYQLCDEKVIRFQGNDHFPLEDKGVLWVYTKQSVTTVSRGGTKTITTYYFSKGGNSEIKVLTLLNLKAAFPENHMLHDAIDEQFKTDASLGIFDEYHKHYKINHFLESQNIK
jgi:hypothetical protein